MAEALKQDLFLEANSFWSAGKNSKALARFIAAAESGEHIAFNTIGYFFDHGIGTAKNATAALSWYKKAAKFGDTCAYSNVGICYRDAKNYRQAKFWLERAWATGDHDALFELGKVYLMASNSTSALAKAKDLIRKAIDSEELDKETKKNALQILLKLNSK